MAVAKKRTRTKKIKIIADEPEDIIAIPEPMPPTVHHIPHEHFIMALSLFVIALSSVLLTSDTAVSRTTSESVLGVTIAAGGSSGYSSSTPPAYACVDSDGGGNASGYTAGSVRVTDSMNNTITLSDECFNATAVKEYYCSTTTTDPGYRTINETCYNGYCQNGACKKTFSCTDTDAGDTSVRGALTFTNTQTGVTSTTYDTCYSATGVQENVCNENWNNGFYQYQTGCQSGGFCQNGACVAPAIIFTPATSTPVDTITSGKNVSLARFTFVPNTSSVNISQITTSIKANYLSIFSPVLRVGTTAVFAGKVVGVSTTGESRIYKISFTNLNLSISKNFSGAFTIQAGFINKADPILKQEGGLTIGLTTNDIVITGGTIPKILGLPWDSGRLVVQ